MFGTGFPCSLPLCCPQPMMMCPVDIPVPQPYPCPVSIPQPYIQNCYQPVDCPIQNTIQPVIVPTPVNVPFPQPIPIPVDRPCAVPVPQPVPVPVDRPCAVPIPVPVPQPCVVPQPYIVREQVCVPVPVPVQQQPYMPCYEEEYCVEEPICVKRCRRRRHHHRSRTPAAPLPPIIIPVPIQPPAQEQQTPMQVIEYVQDIYPSAQVYTDQVPIGFVASNSTVQQQMQTSSQQNLNCKPGIILPPAPYHQMQQQIVQRIPGCQTIGRPLSVGGHQTVQTVISQTNASPTVFNC